MASGPKGEYLPLRLGEETAALLKRSEPFLPLSFKGAAPLQTKKRCG